MCQTYRGLLAMHRFSISLVFTGLAVLITASGCTIHHSGCESASGPLMLGGPSGSCTGCGELYIDPWLNHPPRRTTSGCQNCESPSLTCCRGCTPLRTGMKVGLKRLFGEHQMGCGCDVAPITSESSCGVEFEVSCGIEHEASCGIEYPSHRGSRDVIIQSEPACGFPTNTLGIHKPTQNVTLPTETRSSGQAIRITKPQRSIPMSQKYPMDTRKIFQNRTASHRTSN